MSDVETIEKESPASSDTRHVAVRDLKTYYEDSGLFRSDPVRAVDGVSFDIERGETLGIVGESGCGKTTLGHSLLGLEEPTAGTIEVDGRDVTDLSGSQRREWRKDAQIVFQDPDESLNGRMTVGEIVREPLDAHGWKTPEERRDRVFEMLDRVGLSEEHYYRYPHEFSGGQRQRIGIARALTLEPNLLILDEPVSALDVSVQARIINLLEDLQDEYDLTYLFIAHDLAVVRHISDRVAVMYLGKIVEIGPTESLFSDPNHPYTVSLLSAIPGSHGTEGDRVTLAGSPPSPRYPPSGCRFHTRCPVRIRPDEFDLPDDAWSAIDQFRDIVRSREHETDLGDRLKRRVGLGGPDVSVAVEETFDGVALPTEAREVVDAATELATEGQYEDAIDRLEEAFGSVCERENPHGALEEGDRVSHCHRHRTEYESVDAALDRRT